MSKCIHANKLHDNLWCSTACMYCTLSQEETCRHRKDVPDINDVKTNGDRIRSMTDEELVEFLYEYGAYTVCDLVCGGGCKAFASLKETSDEKCRRIILEKLRAPYKEKEHGQTIGTDTEA